MSFDLLAAADPAPSWVILVATGAFTFFGGAGLWGFLQNRVSRRDQRQDALAAARKEAVKGDAVVEAERVKADASERERVFKALQTNESRYAQEVGDMRKELNQARTTFGHEVRNIQQYITTLQDLYHALYTAAAMLAQNYRIVRARLKRQAESAGEKFDEEEFPPMDMSVFDPKRLPKYQPVAAWENAGSTNEKKISGRITLTPDDHP